MSAKRTRKFREEKRLRDAFLNVDVDLENSDVSDDASQANTFLNDSFVSQNADSVVSQTEFSGDTSPVGFESRSSDEHSSVSNVEQYDSSVPSEHTDLETDNSSDVDLREPHEILAEDLQFLYIKHKLTSNFMEDLLKALKKHTVFENLPARTPTLMRSQSRGLPDIENVVDQLTAEKYEYTYFGVLNGIQRQVELSPVLRSVLLTDKEVHLVINTDGAPLFKKSYFNKTAWPLLGKIYHPEYRVPPFTIALHVGNSKPEHTRFLKDFVREMNALNGNYFEIDSIHVKITLLLLTADAPARAFLKQIIGHNGTAGCEKCFLNQSKVGGKRCNFEFKRKNDVKLRTNANFRSQEDAMHHKSKSRLVYIKNLDMIRQIVLDALHLIDEGVVKKFLFSLAIEKKGIYRISKGLLHEFNRDINI